ncbi:cytochrome b [Elioraea thermophila]|uniref:cytochrome b n=1 Tax=Elioraea thermophila TaxID=2185104 RepID=UPI000DF20D96|nr:cytochrome b/b6 domain-containing protein [Elioraea thermophila]
MSQATARLLEGTDAAHPDGQYSTVAKWFHWITLGLMLIALPTGFVIKYIKPDPFATKLVFYAIHESAGLTILFVSVARLAWRIANPPPPLPAHLPVAMRVGAQAVHGMLYAALILQPIFGFLATNAWGFPMQGATAYLGFIDIPAVVAKDETLARALQATHTWIAYALVVLLVLHVGAAIWHHAIRRDGTLMRML